MNRIAVMLIDATFLHRSPQGVLSTDFRSVVLRVRPNLHVARTASIEALRAGELDPALLEAFGLTAMTEALARDVIANDRVNVRRRWPGENTDRRSVKRVWSFGRGDPRAAWIHARRVSAMAGEDRYEASFDDHLARGFPALFQAQLGATIVDEVRAVVEALHALPCLCDTGLEVIGHHDALKTLITRTDPRAPVDVRVTVGYCTVCALGWTFQASGDSHHGYSCSASTFLPVVGFTEDEVALIVGRVRAGAEVTVGGSRLHTTFSGRGGEIVAEEFDEGASTESPCTPASLRSVIEGSPNAFLDVVRAPLKLEVGNALLAGTNAQERLDELLAYGECLSRVDLLEAVLAWPAEKPTEAARAQMVKDTSGLDAYHAIMGAVGYPAKSPAVGELGDRFFSTLEEVLGEDSLPRLRRYHAGFRAMRGDLDGALEDLEWERARQAKDDPDAESLRREIEATTDQRLALAVAAAPDDDTPRLVWADALLERGNPRGELIVAQCALGRIDEHDAARAALELRARQLVAVHGAGWAGRPGARFGRGFVESVDVRWPLFEQNADALFALAPPLREIRFVCPREDMMEHPERALDDRRLEGIAALDFSSPCFKAKDPDSDGDNVTRFGHELLLRIRGRLAGLRSLTMRNGELTAKELALIGARSSLTRLDLGDNALHGLLGSLLGPGRLPELRALNLSFCSLDETDAPALAQLSRLDELDLGSNALSGAAANDLSRLGVSKLRLRQNVVDDDGAALLRNMPNLRTLDLSGNEVGNRGVVAIAGLPLTSLDLEDTCFDESGLAALLEGGIASSLRRLRLGTRLRSLREDRGRGFSRGVSSLIEGLPQLWEIDLRGCDIDGDGACALLDALPSLRWLRLGQCAVDDAGLAKLVSHPRFVELECLELDRNKLGPDAGAVLARAPRLPMRLVLYGNDLGDAGARALAEASTAARLVSLELQDNLITAEGGRALVESPHLENVALLDLAYNALGEGVSKTRALMFGERLVWDAYHTGISRYYR